MTTIGRGAHISQNELLGHLPPLKGKTTQVKFLAQHPELHDAFNGIWVNADGASATLFSLELPMPQVLSGMQTPGTSASSIAQ